jgi:hypothetical protein
MGKVWTFIGGVITGVAGVIAAAIIDEKLDECRRGRRCDEESGEEPDAQGEFRLP